VSRSKNSARLALYRAANRERSEPRITTLPSMVQTHHLHALPRLFKATSKVGSSYASISRYQRSHCKICLSAALKVQHLQGVMQKTYEWGGLGNFAFNLNKVIHAIASYIPKRYNRVKSI
jgi:hypothetical protein